MLDAIGYVVSFQWFVDFWEAVFSIGGNYAQHAPYADCASWCAGEGDTRCTAPGCKSKYRHPTHGETPMNWGDDK